MLSSWLAHPHLAETRTVWNTRWGLLSALHCCVAKSGDSNTRHSSDRCILPSPMWSFTLSQCTGWIEKKKTVFVSCVGKWRQETRSSFYFTQCTAKLCDTLLPEASAVSLATRKQHSSLGLLRLVTTSLSLLYRLEIKIQFNIWQLWSSQYVFSLWPLVAAALRYMEIHDKYQIHTVEPPDF